MITSSFFEHGTKVLTGICSDSLVQNKYYGRKMRKVHCYLNENGYAGIHFYKCNQKFNL